MTKAALIGAILVLLSTTAGADCQVIARQDVPSTSQAQKTYISMLNESNLSTSSAANEVLYDHLHLPVAMTAHSLHAQVSIAPGGSDVWTIVLRKNTSTSTSLTCQITGSNTSCDDLVNVPTFVAGDTLHLRVWSADGATAPTTSGQMLISLCLDTP
jgi:hypothetical protein